VISLNLVLAGLRLGLKNRQVGEKWISDDCSYFFQPITRQNRAFKAKAKIWLSLNQNQQDFIEFVRKLCLDT
jgi:hypothetical protein